MSKVGGRGIRMSSISGNIEVGLPDGANADWRVSSISGRVIVDAPNVTMQKNGPADFEGRVGGGGTEMTFSSISGNVPSAARASEAGRGVLKKFPRRVSQIFRRHER